MLKIFFNTVTDGKRKTMKRLILILACSVFVISLDAQNWAKGSVSGEGDVVKKEITLDKFESVSLSFGGDVILTKGSPQKVEVEAQQNIIENIKKEVKDGKWKIRYEKRVRNAKPVKVYITMPYFKSAGVSGSGSMTTTNTFTGLGDVKVYVSGSGDLNFDLEADELRSAISGSGDIVLEGTANDLDISISGSGDVEAFDLETKNCEISVSGSGDTQVNVSGELKISISGSGDVKYKGNPTKLKSSVSGSGDVESS
jgi:hypothetical protein